MERLLGLLSDFEKVRVPLFAWLNKILVYVFYGGLKHLRLFILNANTHLPVFTYAKP